MIGVIFQFGAEVIEVRVNQENVLFRTNQTHGGFSPIEGLQLDKKGVVKEHPDLENDPEWRNKSIERFKEKVKSYKTEKERMDYIMDDLKKFGYVPLYYQREGFRPKKLKQ